MLQRALLMIVVCICLFILSLYALPTLMLILVGFWPAVIIFLLESDSRLRLTSCVGFMNFSGILSQAIILWMKGHTLNGALYMVSQPITWIVMYGSAVVGLVLYLIMPIVCSQLLWLWAKFYVDYLSQHQEKILETWGNDVK